MISKGLRRDMVHLLLAVLDATTATVGFCVINHAILANLRFHFLNMLILHQRLLRVGTTSLITAATLYCLGASFD